MPLREALERADVLGAEGRYFDAHEELEAHWMKASGEEKILLQGLIQLAAGLHRLKLDPSRTDGAFYLLERGLQKLTRARALLEPAPLDELTRTIEGIRAAGRAPESLAFGLTPAR